MKQIITIAIIMLGLGLLGNKHILSGAPADSKMIITTKLVNDMGKNRYDVHVGNTFYSFSSLEMLKNFTDEIDPSDDTQIKAVREQIKNELQTKTIEQFFNTSQK